LASGFGALASGIGVVGAGASAGFPGALAFGSLIGLAGVDGLTLFPSGLGGVAGVLLSGVAGVVEAGVVLVPALGELGDVFAGKVTSLGRSYNVATP
jgi:hypothetical protein